MNSIKPDTLSTLETLFNGYSVPSRFPLITRVQYLITMYDLDYDLIMNLYKDYKNGLWGSCTNGLNLSNGS